MSFLIFFKAYRTQLWGLAGGAVVSAAALIISLAPERDLPLKVWFWFLLCIGFIILSGWRTVRERERIYQQLVDEQLEERREFQAVLKDEQDRNSRPDITVTIDSAAFDRKRPYTSTGKGGREGFVEDAVPVDLAEIDELEKDEADETEDTGTLRVFLRISLRNSRPQSATIDNSGFAMITRSGRVDGKRAYGSKSLDPNSQGFAQRIPELEPNVPLQQGMTVSRFVTFDVAESRISGTEWPADGTFEFWVLDSFGDHHRVSRTAAGLSGSCGEATLS